MVEYRFTSPTHQQPQPTFPAPPQRPAWMERPIWVVPIIIGLNGLVFLAWRIPLFQQWLFANFTVSTTHLWFGRIWTLLTSAFSHAAPLHLAVNMFVLWSFGQVLERLLRLWVFIGFYLGAALVASVCHCLGTLAMGRAGLPALGASGAVSGLLVIFALLFPRHRVLLFFIIPMPVLMAVLGFVGFDIWGLFAQSRGGGLSIGHGAHLGGALSGALFYLAYLRPRIKRARELMVPPERPTPSFRVTGPMP